MRDGMGPRSELHDYLAQNGSHPAPALAANNANRVESSRVVPHDETGTIVQPEVGERSLKFA